MFDGIGAPTTQSFGVGIFEDLTPEALDEMEHFFTERGAEVMHEVCPLAGTQALDLLCRRGYRPIEISNVLYRPVEKTGDTLPSDIQVRMVSAADAGLWSSVSARGWMHEHPELEGFLLDLGELCVARADSPCFLAELNGVPGAAGTLIIHKGVALFGGSATIPESRRRGLQAALLHERMRYAADHACDIAMMVAEAGSNSQRNAERKGFQVAYTRTKWQLKTPQSN